MEKQKRVAAIHDLSGYGRCALTVILPGRKKPFALVDCGANVDCQPKYLLQFGLMGSVYMKEVLEMDFDEGKLFH
mgnify:CR=1 FL=1